MPCSSSPAVSEIERGDAEVIEESGEVGAGTERVDAQIGALAKFFAIVGGLGVGDFRELQALPDGQLGLRIFDVAGDAVDELLQRVRTAHGEQAAIVAVGVDVDGGVLAQLVGVGFDPFGGTEQHGFFAVPRGVDDGAARLPALLEQHRPGRGLLPAAEPGRRRDLRRR